jgi:hypothetical protein
MQDERPPEDRILLPEDLDNFSLKRYVRTRGFAVRVVLGIVLVIAARLTNSGFLGWGLFVCFAILIVPIKRARSFLFAFVPYAALWFLFTLFRSLADETVLAETLNTKVASFERWLFGGQLPTIMLQDRFYNPNHLHWYDYMFTFTHWSYFIVPHIVAIRLWYKHPERFRRYLAGMTVFFAAGLMIYFLIPSNPPWMAPEPINSPAAAPVYRVMENVASHIGGGLYAASYNVVGESNPIAAMPSMHLAMTFYLIFPAWYAGRKWFIAAIIYALMMATALVYNGEHYVVDVTMGAIIATYGWFAAGYWLKAIAPLMKSRFGRAAQTAATGPHPQIAE